MISNIQQGLPNQAVYNLYGEDLSLMQLIFLRNNTEDETMKDMLTSEINKIQKPVLDRIAVSYDQLPELKEQIKNLNEAV